MAGSRIWQCQQNAGSSSLTPISGIILRQRNSWHKWTYVIFFLRITFAESEAHGVKQSSVLGQLYLTVLHHGCSFPSPSSWSSSLYPAVPSLPPSHCPTALTTHTARSWRPCVEAARSLAVTSPPTRVLTQRTPMNAPNGFFLP